MHKKRKYVKEKYIISGALNRKLVCKMINHILIDLKIDVFVSSIFIKIQALARKHIFVYIMNNPLFGYNKMYFLLNHLALYNLPIVIRHICCTLFHENKLVSSEKYCIGERKNLKKGIYIYIFRKTVNLPMNRVYPSIQL